MEYYSWRVRGKPVEVRLNLPMLRYMVPWIRDHRACSRPNPSVCCWDVSGGGWGRFLIMVEDFEPFDPAKPARAPQRAARLGTEGGGPCTGAVPVRS